MNKDQIIDIIDIARQEKWSYPKIFEGFKEAGVEAYEVKLDTFELTYFGSQQAWKKPISLNLSPLKINRTFSVDKLIEVWDRHQKGKTSYTVFLHDAARAGVKEYRVDMNGRTITFSGVNSTKQHCEYIP